MAAVALVSCSSAPQASSSPPTVSAPSPTASNTAESKAADFRVRLDLLLGEHVMIIAKQSAATTRQAEYTGYLRLLAANGNDLTELVRSALGDSTAARFQQIWSSQNASLVTYTIGLATHNQSKAGTALSGLTRTFVPQFSQFLNDVTQIPSALIVPLVNQHALEMKTMLDDQLARNYPKLYADIRTAYTHATQVGDAVAPKLAGQFPDKFPGNASGPAADLRTSLNLRLQEHSYLATMRTSAAIGHRPTELAAAAGALAENATTLDALFTDLFGPPVGVRFDQAWAAGNAALIADASASTMTAKQRALSTLNDAFVTQLSNWLTDSTGLSTDVSRPPLEAQLEAVITVIEDQRSKSWARLAADDRSAETASAVVADLLATAAIAKLPARFGA